MPQTPLKTPKRDFPSFSHNRYLRSKYFTKPRPALHISQSGLTTSHQQMDCPNRHTFALMYLFVALHSPNTRYFPPITSIPKEAPRICCPDGGNFRTYLRNRTRGAWLELGAEPLPSIRPPCYTSSFLHPLERLHRSELSAGRISGLLRQLKEMLRIRGG